MSSEDLPSCCAPNNDDDWKKKESAKYTNAILDFIDNIQKKDKKKKSSFTQKVVEEARRISQDKDPITRSQNSLKELRTIVSQLDDTHKKTDKTRRASSFLQPFFDAITRYTEVIETLVSSDPTIAALVWGGVKCVFQIAGEFSQHYDNLTNILQKLEPHLCNIGRLSEIFDWSESLCNVVTKSYQDIFNLLVVVAESYEQSGLKTLLIGVVRPFDRKTKRLEDQVEKNMKAVWESAMIAQNELAKQQAKDNEKKKLDQWLQSPASDPTYDHCIDHKHPGTCNWLFETPDYQRWETGKKNVPSESVLWIYGPPGIGKTFLASSIVERLKSQSREVLYYYFRDENSGNRNQPGWGEALSMLRNIIRQLLDVFVYKRKHQLPTGFWDIYDKSGGSFLTDIDVAINVIQLLLKVLPRITIVVDGLDECINRHQLANKHCPAWKSDHPALLPSILSRLVQSTHHGIVKWCFTSCPETDISNLLKGMNAITMEVTEKDVKGDVINFLVDTYQDELDIRVVYSEDGAAEDVNADQELSEDERAQLPHSETDEKDHNVFIMGLLRNLMSVSFLDARLTLELLKGKGGATTSQEMMQSVLSYKDGFNNRYLRGIRLLAEKPKNERELARRIISIASVSERPITRNEFLAALAVQPDQEYSLVNRPHPAKFDEMLAPLLELDRSTSIVNPTVRFIHRTAKEFMQQEIDDVKDLPETCKDFFSPLENRHLEFGKVCLRYLRQQRLQFGSTKEMEEHLCRNIDSEELSFLKYASIFWHHHLNLSPGNDDVFRSISAFMRSSNFITCLWVQSKYAPYQLTRYTRGEEGMSYHIQNPTDIFTPSEPEVFYADPLPGWLSRFNPEGERLVQACQQFIKEYGLVLLRRRGGIRSCYGCSLGLLNFLPPVEGYDWRALPLQDDQPVTSLFEPGDREHVICAQLTSSKHIVARTLTLHRNAKSLDLGIKEWHISSSRKRSKALTLRRQTQVSLPSSSQIYSTPKLELKIDPDVFALIEADDTILSPGTSTEDIVKIPFESNSTVPMGFNTPEGIMAKHPKNSIKGKPDSFWRNYASNGDACVISYYWHVPEVASTQDVRPTRAGDRLNSGLHSHRRNTDFSSASSSDSESDADSDSDSDSDPSDFGFNSRNKQKLSDIGYTSSAGSATSVSVNTELKFVWYISIAVKKTNQLDCQLYHFETEGMPLRQSPLVVHPTKPFIILPLDGPRTVVINYFTGESKILHDDTTSQCVSKVLHFSTSDNPELFEIATSRDFVERSRWTVQLNCLKFETGSPGDIDAVSITRRELSSVSWVSPYTTPYEIPVHPELPFKITWSKKHVFLVFGACEVYIARMPLDTNGSQTGAVQHDGPSSTENTSNSSAESLSSPNKVQTTKNPAFLPASTTERAFSYLPQKVDGTEYGCFLIAGNSTLPPVLIRQDIAADLGGWVDYDPSTHLGYDGVDEDDDMKGKYSCNAMSFRMPIRSGLAWNNRVEVICGQGAFVRRDPM